MATNICTQQEKDNLFKKTREFYDSMNFVHGSCGLFWNPNKGPNGDKDNRGIMPTKEERLTTQPYNPSLTGMYIIPEDSGITAIDFDDIKLCPELYSLSQQHCKYIVETKKEFHHYYKERNDVPYTLQKALGFDIPRLLFCPPSYYMNGDKI